MDSTVIFLLMVVLVLIYFYINFSNRSSKKQIKSDMSILPQTFIVADIETTGLDPNNDEIIEIAAIQVNRDSNLHNTFNALVKPSKHLPKKIIDMTGITQKLLDEEGESIESAMNEFLDFIGDKRLVFYNAPFDLGFLKRAATRVDRKIANPVSDALKMAKKAFPKQNSYKLSELAKAGKLDTSGAHRALNDCRMTLIVYSASATTLGKID